MGKYTAEFKLTVVQRYLEGTMGYRILAEHFGISNHSLIERWVGFFRHHGKDGLTSKRASYSANFKFSVLQHMWDNMLSQGQTAAAFNIRRPATVGTWERAYRAGGIEALASSRRRPHMQPAPEKPDTPEVDNRSREELLAELLELRVEVAYLKKLEALVREQKQSTLRKKRK